MTADTEEDEEAEEEEEEEEDASPSKAKKRKGSNISAKKSKVGGVRLQTFIYLLAN